MQSSLSSLTAFAISLPFSLSHSFVSNVRISDSSLSSSSHFFLFFPFFFYLSLPFYAIYPRCPTLFITRQHFYISRYTFYERKSSSPPFRFPLPRSPRIVPPSIIIPSPPPPPPRDSASPVLFSSTFRRSRIHTLKWTSKSGRGGIKKVFTACSDPSPPPCSINAFEEIQRLVARGSAKGQGKKRKETKGRQIGDCNLRGTDPRGWGIRGIRKNE